MGKDRGGRAQPQLNDVSRKRKLDLERERVKGEEAPTDSLVRSKSTRVTKEGKLPLRMPFDCQQGDGITPTHCFPNKREMDRFQKSSEDLVVPCRTYAVVPTTVGSNESNRYNGEGGRMDLRGGRPGSGARESGGAAAAGTGGDEDALEEDDGFGEDGSSGSDDDDDYHADAPEDGQAESEHSDGGSDENEGKLTFLEEIPSTFHNVPRLNHCNSDPFTYNYLLQLHD